MRIFYYIWQYLIALPLFTLLTIFTAVTTLIFQHWRNSWWLHAIQAFWSRSFYYLLFLPVKVTGTENIDSFKERELFYLVGHEVVGFLLR